MFLEYIDTKMSLKKINKKLDNRFFYVTFLKLNLSYQVNDMNSFMEIKKVTFFCILNIGSQIARNDSSYFFFLMGILSSERFNVSQIW